MPLQKLKRWLLIFSLCMLVVISGLAAVIQLYVFPHIDDYRGRIEQTLTQSLKQQVTIGHIAIRWRGLAPQVTLGDVTLFDQQKRAALALPKVTSRLSWSSVFLLSPTLVSLNIQAPTLVIRRNAQGELFLAGIPLAGQGDPAFANWLLAQRRITISQATVTWLDELRQAPPLLLKELNIDIHMPVWHRLLNRHAVHIDTLVSTGTQQRIVLDATLVGSDVARPEQWRGEIALRLPDTDLATWSPWLDLPVQVTAGKGALTTSMRFEQLQLQQLAAQLQLSGLSIVPPRYSEPFVAKQARGEVRWQRVEQRHLLSLSHFSADIQPGLLLDDVNGELQWDAQGHEGRLTAKHLAVTDSPLLARWLPAEHAARTYLEHIAPAGHVRQLKSRWHFQHQQWQDYYAEADFDGLHTQAYEHLPGLKQWAGHFNVEPNAGSVELETRAAEIELAGILRWPLPIDQLQGEVSWRHNGQKTLISARNLLLNNPHLRLRTELDYQLGAANGDTIQLNSHIEHADAKYAPFYYPTILGETTLHWLDTSVLSGLVKHGEVIVKGRVADFPFVNTAHQPDPSLGLFRVTAQVDQATLEYGTGWPLVQNLSALLKFEGKRMDISVKNGTTVGQHITQAQAEIPRLDADWPILNIKSQVSGTLDQGIKFVNTSPVKEVTMGFTDDLKASGNGELKLALQVPLNDVDASQFQGDYLVKNGHLAANPRLAMPEMSNIQGHLKFNEKSLQANGIQLQLFDNPATLSLTTRPDKSVVIQGSGRITDAALRKLDNNPFTRALHGTTDWRSNILVQAPDVRVDIRSQLLGMAIDLPEPAKKAADAVGNLTIRFRQENHQADKIAIHYNDWLHANLLRNPNSTPPAITAGEISINQPPRFPAAEGINLRADMPKLNVDEWLAAINGPAGNAGASTWTNSAASLPALSLIELSAATLRVFDRPLHQVKLTIKPENERLNMQMQSQELAGEANWVAGKPSHLTARLNYLRIPRNIDPQEAAASGEIRRLDLSYPEVDITAQEFQFGDKALGSLELKAFNSGENWVIQRMAFNNADSQLNAEGTWRNSVRAPQTQLKFTLNSSNLGKTLQRFQPSASEMVKGGNGNLNGQIGWPGSPHEFAVERLDGSFTMQLEKGQILKVQPGVGRLLGLLSLQSLPRRLTLDFRDLFSEGFAFDKISSSAMIKDGILRSDDFLMTGPAAEARIKGETNLKTETQRLRVKVMPHITDSVSLAALAGGPIVGVTAFLAQKLLKDPLNKISTSEYMIIGTWDNPQEAEVDNKPSPASTNPASKNLR